MVTLPRREKLKESNVIVQSVGSEKHFISKEE